VEKKTSQTQSLPRNLNSIMASDSCSNCGGGKMAEAEQWGYGFVVFVPRKILWLKLFPNLSFDSAGSSGVVSFYQIIVRYSGRRTPLNAKLNPICHLLALLGAHHILHVSRIRVNRRHITHKGQKDFRHKTQNNRKQYCYGH